DIGQYAKALTLAQQALEVRKKTLGENHPDYALSLRNLATLYWDMEDYAKALPLPQQALEVTKKTLAENQPGYAASLTNLAALYKERGDYAHALPLLRQALDIDTDAWTRDLAILSERQRLRRIADRRISLNNYLVVALAAQVPADQTYRNLLTWK